MLPLLLAIAELVPAILRFNGKDNAAVVVDQGVAIAKQITGKGEPLDALAAVRADPQLLLQFQAQMNQVVIAEMDAETRRLEAVNATMRAEYASSDAYVRRARPTFLYAMALSWTLQMLGLSIAIAVEPSVAGDLISAAADLTTMWGVALAVVGVYVKARSDEKKIAAGVDAPSLLESIGSMLKKPK